MSLEGIIYRQNLQKKELEEALDKLQQEYIEAEKVHVARNRFIACMSHDLRTPMNAIQGYSMLIEKYADDREKVKYYSRQIYVSGQLLLELINDILDMNCIENGALNLKDCEFDWVTVMKEIHATLKPQAEAKKQTLCFYIINSDQVDWIIGDRQCLCRILRNLLSNAIKYTPEHGSVDATIDVTKVDEKTVQMICMIKDTGCGMSKEFLEVLFEPFERESSDRNISVIGTGLGMSIVRNFTELMNGDLVVESELGVGTLVTVRLPFAIAQGQNQRADSGFDMDNVLNGLHFLAAEDNESNAEILYEVLKLMGAECTIARHGREVVEVFEQSVPGKYDAILMDIQMPVMDGYMAASAIRRSQHPDAGSIKIIAMTADAYEDDKCRAFAAGMDAHVAKPIVVKEFVNAIEALNLIKD